MQTNNPKTILITGATDGIGLAAAKQLLSQGHTVLLHGRSANKMDNITPQLASLNGEFETYLADFSNMKDVQKLANEVLNKHTHIDVLINNAGVLKAPKNITEDGIDIRFAVNTLAPYLLTSILMPAFSSSSRIVNLSSAAQSSVDIRALTGQVLLSEMEAYAQSKLAITIWSKRLAESRSPHGPIFIALNPGSLLASKMVKEGFGIEGKDLSIGANIIVSAALDAQFASASGLYFDNDMGNFGTPHPDASNSDIVSEVVAAIKHQLAPYITSGSQ